MKQHLTSIGLQSGYKDLHENIQEIKNMPADFQRNYIQSGCGGVHCFI